METIEIRSGDIRLGQLLKLHGVAEHGVMAKDMIAAGDVLVNGEVNTRRSAKIVTGDVVAVPAAGVEFTVVQALEPPIVS
ncbi:RNA-binding S4 domain-containing protein [Brevibacterium sp. p3-SID960]|uniref:RNA-binding S4 domain-containing protein n=1 Tax=Brevibacterium sp. p3-SID960 TaxID=2916063 RepID=UPI0021A3702F|nr:RNA-binding S4 domain-containing protein [Brevibacterium sp. p3-SID960]MCT1690453.1 RNA-binding S4 domain-containing protein [Brevibacterium sp. p3-SID960]